MLKNTMLNVGSNSIFITINITCNNLDHNNKFKPWPLTIDIHHDDSHHHDKKINVLFVKNINLI